ncbi:MAG: glycosyltransferase family 4 protein [Nitrospinae bacterium]|nr:glycosyltransferase family 4 protein [Nitrospinota bacterium]
MPKILIDACKLTDSSVKDGCYRYTKELVKGLQKSSIPSDVEVDLFVFDKIIRLQDYNDKENGAPNQEKVKSEEKSFIKIIKEMFSGISLFRNMYSKLKILFWSLKFKEYDIVHIALPAHYYLYAPVVPFSSTKIIVTVHDLTTITFPQFHEEMNIKQHNEGYKFLTKHADAIITDSLSTKNDFLSHFSYDTNNVFSIHLGFNRNIFHTINENETIQNVQEKYQIQSPYILSIGTIEPRKNLLKSIQAYNRLVKNHPDVSVNFVLIGQTGWNSSEILNEIYKNKERIQLLGFVPDEDLAPLYNGALFFCYASFYEGFGLPLLESIACETPVIYGNNSSMPEVVGECGLGVHSNDINDIYEKMEHMTLDDTLRGKLKEKCANQASTFSWELCAKETFHVYQKVLPNRE